MKKLLLILMISLILQMHRLIIMATVTIIHIFSSPQPSKHGKEEEQEGKAAEVGTWSLKKTDYIRLYAPDYEIFQKNRGTKAGSCGVCRLARTSAMHCLLFISIYGTSSQLFENVCEADENSRARSRGRKGEREKGGGGGVPLDPLSLLLFSY